MTKKDAFRGFSLKKTFSKDYGVTITAKEWILYSDNRNRQGAGRIGGPRNPYREDHNAKQDLLCRFEAEPGWILRKGVGMVQQQKIIRFSSRGGN